jgi:hypothetical protein
MVAAILEYPLDLAKVRLQSQSLFETNSAPLRFNGPWDCLVKTWKCEGVRGLYRVRLLPSRIRDVALMMVVGITRPRSRGYGRDSCYFFFLLIFQESYPGRLQYGQRSAVIDTPTGSCGGRRRLCYQLRYVRVKFLALKHFLREFRLCHFVFCLFGDSFRAEHP